jgi:tripartite-type tricarboxylate transporter receptor subunit TctC
VQSAVVARLHDAIAKAVRSPEVSQKIEAGGEIPNGESLAEMAAEIASVAEIGARLMKLAGVQPE